MFVVLDGALQGTTFVSAEEITKLGKARELRNSFKRMNSFTGDGDAKSGENSAWLLHTAIRLSGQKSAKPDANKAAAPPVSSVDGGVMFARVIRDGDAVDIACAVGLCARSIERVTALEATQCYGITTADFHRVCEEVIFYSILYGRDTISYSGCLHRRMMGR